MSSGGRQGSTIAGPFYGPGASLGWLSLGFREDFMVNERREGSEVDRRHFIKRPTAISRDIDVRHFQLNLLRAFELRPALRDVYILCEVQEFSIAQAAAILGVETNRIQERLEAARRHIKDAA
jgi:DNA-directed RNA polymerase specialized sigma24 family protein